MARKLLWSLVLVTLAAPAWAATRTATISGSVRNAAGVGQMGALVEVIPAGQTVVRRAFCDDRGQYVVTGLAPGRYSVKASATSFLPSLRENVQLAAGAHLLVNVTLNTLLEAIQLLPQRRNSPGEQDDWNWTLRSAGNRPILRVLDDGQSVVVASSERARDRRLRAHVAFVAGAEAAGFGSNADATTNFSLEHSMFSTGTLAFQGNVGYGEGEPGGVVRATYSQQMGDSRPEIALTARRFAAVATAPQYGAVEAFSVTTSDTMTLAEAVELTAGSDFQVVEFARQVHAVRPFGRIRIHLDPDTLLEYRYASSQPNMRAAKGFDTAPADLSESAPRFSLDEGEPVLERARHHELSLSRRFGRTSVQAAAYMDQVSDAALLGVGTVEAGSGDLLPDVYSNTFSWNGGDLRTTGARVVVQRRLAGDVTATVDYATGGVIAISGAPGPLRWEQVQASLRNERRHAVAAKFVGSVPRARTRWLVSYRWTNGRALTPVDWFDASPGQADPYLSLFLRQPLPQVDFLPGHMELLVDVRNLLAQGYVPVFGHDGQTLYLVQAARSVRGGVAFNF